MFNFFNCTESELAAHEELRAAYAETLVNVEAIATLLADYALDYPDLKLAYIEQYAAARVEYRAARLQYLGY